MPSWEILFFQLGKFIFPVGKCQKRSYVILELFPAYNAEESIGQNLHVEQPGTVLQIVKVEVETTQHFLHRICISIVEGGIGSDTRANLVETLVTGVTLHNLVDEILAFGAGTHKSHVADEHVPQLGKLIEMVLSEKFARFGQTVVVVLVKQAGTILLCIHLHAPELIDIKRLATLSYPFLFIDGRLAIFPDDGEITNQKQR